MKAGWRKQIALTAASLYLCLAMFGQTSKKTSFYQSIQHAIIQLQHIEPAYDPVKHVSMSNVQNGTAFFVEKEGSFYVITAAHVAREPFAFTAKIPLLLLDGTSVEVHLTLPADKWVLHPNRGDQMHAPVDVAAMKIVNHNGIKWFYYCSKEVDCPKNTIIVSKEDMEPPTPVMVFGFPLNEPGLNLLRPVSLGRQGIIALVDKEEDEIKVGEKFFDRLGFVIDIPTIIGGYSGSPIISVSAGVQESLVGVVSASTNKDDYAVAGGYAIAEPVSRITELLNDPKLENMQAVDTWCLPSKDDVVRLGSVISACQ